MGLVIAFVARGRAPSSATTTSRRTTARSGSAGARSRRAFGARRRSTTSGPRTGRLPRRPSPAATSRRSCWPASSTAIPDLLLVGQPTRGVDIGAIEFIHRRLVALRDAGKARRCSSRSSSTRSCALADRILVMHDGRIVGEVPQADGHRADARPHDGRRRSVTAPHGRRSSRDWAGLARRCCRALNLALRAARSPAGRDRRCVGESPLRALRLLAAGAFGNARGDRLHALLRDELRLHRARGRRRVPRRALQHRGRGPGVHRRPRRRARAALARAAGRRSSVMPAAIVASARLRRGLGASSRHGCRRGAAATSSSRRSCSTSSPRR